MKSSAQSCGQLKCLTQTGKPNSAPADLSARLWGRHLASLPPVTLGPQVWSQANLYAEQGGYSHSCIRLLPWQPVQIHTLGSGAVWVWRVKPEWCQSWQSKQTSYCRILHWNLISTSFRGCWQKRKESTEGKGKGKNWIKEACRQVIPNKTTILYGI